MSTAERGGGRKGRESGERERAGGEQGDRDHIESYLFFYAGFCLPFPTCPTSHSPRAAETQALSLKDTLSKSACRNLRTGRLKV